MHDVIIAGAGPNGLMLACELRLAGVQPVVLDPLPGPNPEPRANGLVGQVVRLLDRRGLYERLAGSPGPPRPAPQYLFAGFPLDLTVLDENPITILPVPQLEIVRMLAARAAELGVEVRWGHELTGLRQYADAVTVHVHGPDGPTTLTSRYLVGADGGHSATRRLAGIDFPGVTTDRTVNRTAYATLPAAWTDPADGVVTVPGYGPVPMFTHHRTERGLFVYAEFPGRPPLVSTTEWDEPADDSPMTIEELSASASRVLGVPVPLQQAATDGPGLLRRTSGGNARIASRYRDGRVLLVGDAAHVHSSIGGPGLNLGLQDAANLGWKLAAAVRGREQLLDTYESERRPVSERVLMHTQAQQALIAPGPEVTALRTLFAELLADPRTVAHIADLQSGADVRYPAPAGAHPLVGRWAPDLTMTTPSGLRRLAELTRGARPLLLDLTDDATVAAGAQGWSERIDVVTAGPLGRGPATALLVRPDGYVAWASSAARPDESEHHALAAAAADWFGVEALDRLVHAS